MKLRESGMPEESYWETLLDTELILDRLVIDDRLCGVVELGCDSGESKRGRSVSSEFSDWPKRRTKRCSPADW
jgi:hypothetical protein